MLRRTSKFQAELAAIVDVVLVCVAMLAALAMHKLLDRMFPDVFSGDFDLFWHNSWLYVMAAIVWALSLDFSGVYDHFLGIGRKQALARSCQAGLLSLAVMLGLLYVLKLHFVPRTLLALQALFTTFAIYFRLIHIQPLLLRLERPHRLLLAGEPSEADVVRDWLAQRDNRGLFDIIGFLTPPGATPPDGFPAVGTTDDFSSMLHSTAVDDVILLPGHLPTHQVTGWLQQCEIEGIETLMIVSHLKPKMAQMELEEMAGCPVLLYSMTSRSTWALAFKRLMDIFCSAMALVILSPVFLAISLAIRRTSPGPVFFSQRRCTYHGRVFQMHKFRTMVQNAEALREELDAQNEVSGPVFKMKDDPRITPIGRFLRRYSLDELPQLWNVLRGDMSIVGPRPPIPAEVEKYQNWQRRRLSMRGGCTCLWQIGGRNSLGFDEWMRLDLKYIDTWSIALDFKIILKTFGAMIRGTGF